MKHLIKKLLREGLLNEDNINNLRKDLDFKLLSNKVYTQSEMVKLGGNYHLHHGMLMMIRLDDIDGLDPIPGGWNDDEGNYNDFVKGTKLSNKPIEVIYDLPNNVFYLYDGNHRVNQAKINGSKYIKAFVQADKDIYDNWRRKSLREELINESTDYKSISVKHLKGVLKNTTNNSGIKILKQWISDGGDFVKLSPKQHQLLLDIKKGGPKPSMYSPKS